MDSPDPGRLSPRRAALGWGLAAAGLSVLTVVLVHVGAGSSRISLATMLFLSLAVLVAIVGGRWPAVVAAVAGALLLNYFFIPPLHTFDVASGSDLCALLVFALTAVAVASVVDAAARRRAACPRGRARGRDLDDAQPPGPRRGVRRPAAARPGA